MSNATAKQDIEALKKRVGRAPFEQHFGGSDFAPCCFHSGESSHSMHLKQCDEGVWIATCFSHCQRSWDAIEFIRKKENLNFEDALTKLRGGRFTVADVAPPQHKPVVEAMTDEKWEKWGRPITANDVERFAKSREGKGRTASYETFRDLGCLVQGDAIGFPCRRTTEHGRVYDCIKVRLMDKKHFWTENSVSQNGFFNLDAVNPISDVYVVEGQPDTAVMQEAGFSTVSVVTGGQKKFDATAIETLCMAPRIFLVGDQSKSGDPGQKCMDLLQGHLPPEKVHRIYFHDAHDVSELAEKLKQNFEGRIRELTAEALRPWVCRNIPSISKLSAEPTKWLVDRFIPYGCLTMLVGAQGSMKSLMAMYLSQTLSAGKNEFLGRPLLHDIDGWNIENSPSRGRFPRSTPVLYLDRENPQGMVSERSRGTGILANSNFQYWGEWEAEPLPEPDDPRLLEFAAAGGFIVFDSLQDWYPPSFNEIDNAKIVQLMAKFRRLARLGSGVLLLHHFNAAGERSRGGTAFVALTDMAINARKNAEANTVELRAERFRLCANWEIDLRYHWDAGEYHNFAKHYQVELVRDQLESDAIAERIDAKAEKKGLKAKTDTADAERVAQAIAMNPDNAPRTIADKLGMRPSRFERLAKIKGLDWDKGQKLWNGLEVVS